MQKNEGKMQAKFCLKFWCKNVEKEKSKKKAMHRNMPTRIDVFLKLDALMLQKIINLFLQLILKFMNFWEKIEDFFAQIDVLKCFGLFEN